MAWLLALGLLPAAVNCATPCTVTTISKEKVLSNFAADALEEALKPTITYIGDPQAVGEFKCAGFAIAEGVILSTGKATDAALTGGASVPKEGTDFGTMGEKDDFTSIEIALTVDEVVKMSFSYIFASRELPEFGGTDYNDAFFLNINGENLAKLPDGKTVTINNLVSDKNSRATDHSEYVDNPKFDFFPYTGYTKLLTVNGNTKSGLNTINITIYDKSDGQYDSSVFLGMDSLTVNIYTWTLTGSNSGSCSATCGAATRSKPYICRSSEGATDATKCKAAQPAAVVEPCTGLPACAVITYTYAAGPWGACSVTCGTGSQSRERTCASSGGATVADSNCASAAAPALSQPCNTNVACVTETYAWTEGAWGSCSVTCGSGGVQSRDVYCAQNPGNVRASDAQCSGTSRAPIAKPSTTTPCNLGLCLSYSWCNEQGTPCGVWGGCSITCDGGSFQGQQVRDVFCVDNTGARSPASSAQCAALGAAAPSALRACTAGQPCPSFAYVARPWGACSATCDNGYQVRSFDCMNTVANTLAGNDSCGGQLIPSANQPCFVTACPTYTWFPSEWSACSVSCGSGIRTRPVSCRAGGTVGADANCMNLPQPPLQIACTMGACDVPRCPQMKMLARGVHTSVHKANSWWSRQMLRAHAPKAQARDPSGTEHAESKAEL